MENVRLNFFLESYKNEFLTEKIIKETFESNNGEVEKILVELNKIQE